MQPVARTVALTVLFVGALSLSGCVGDFNLAARERFSKTVAFERRGRFRLQNVNGAITVEPWDQNSVEIEAEKAAASQRALEEIQIEVRGQGDEVEVQTRLPRAG